MQSFERETQIADHATLQQVPYFTLHAGLPTVHHYATRTPSPSWKFVQDLPHRKRSHLGQSKAAEDK